MAGTDWLRRKPMKTMKYPAWNKVEYPQLLSSPGTRADKINVDHLEQDMIAEGHIKGVSIKTRLTNILSSSTAEAAILEICSGNETIDGLHIGDSVFIGLADMKSRDFPVLEGETE